MAFCVAIVGSIITVNTDDMVETAFSAYREKDERQKYLDELADLHMFNCDIKMLGVWDTVGALGIPAIFGAVDPVLYGFLDTSLSPIVKNACHALAIDEMRAQFQPTLWTNPPAANQMLEQIWFTGCHSDVGGGSTDANACLADITLSYMMARAGVLGLTFDPAVVALYQSPMKPEYSLDQIHQSWLVINGIPIHRAIAGNAIVSNSVRVRCDLDDNYRPKSLKFTKTGLSKGYKQAVLVSEPS